MSLKQCLKEIRQFKEHVQPQKKVEVRFVMSGDEINLSLPNIHWVWLDLGMRDGCNVQT